jgi:hypothetical protein
MDRLCKYNYRGDRCAHGMISSAACVGEEHCQHVNVTHHRTYHDNCSREQWFGLYCARYRRFFCAGLENCASAQDYFRTMAKFRASVD